MFVVVMLFPQEVVIKFGLSDIVPQILLNNLEKKKERERKKKEEEKYILPGTTRRIGITNPCTTRMDMQNAVLFGKRTPHGLEHNQRLVT